MSLGSSDLGHIRAKDEPAFAFRGDFSRGKCLFYPGKIIDLTYVFFILSGLNLRYSCHILNFIRVIIFLRPMQFWHFIRMNRLVLRSEELRRAQHPILRYTGNSAAGCRAASFAL
ncbi:MAG TPA: hypothetical protein VHZ52_12490 [Acidobacteriaceae bacterium]|jgi:hypothetical protein|nr:hypothetical protein [Acidobacteriaceae bacterium]